MSVVLEDAPDGAQPVVELRALGWSSPVYWYLLSDPRDGAELYVDGSLVLRNGLDVNSPALLSGG